MFCVQVTRHSRGNTKVNISVRLDGPFFTFGDAIECAKDRATNIALSDARHRKVVDDSRTTFLVFDGAIKLATVEVFTMMAAH